MSAISQHGDGRRQIGSHHLGNAAGQRVQLAEQRIGIDGATDGVFDPQIDAAKSVDEAVDDNAALLDGEVSVLELPNFALEF
jgi:hypothetical protein